VSSWLALGRKPPLGGAEPRFELGPAHTATYIILILSCLVEDPCTDFYAYSCGNWARTHARPHGLRHWSNFVRLERRIADIIRRGLEGRGRHRYDSAVEQRARAHYELCRGRNALNLADSRKELHEVFASVNFEIRSEIRRVNLVSACLCLILTISTFEAYVL
jgi:hypothetical protein